MFLKQRDPDAIELVASLRQVKKLYVALFRQLHESRAADFDEIDDDDMLLTLQTYLQRRAREAGVDATDHAQWDAFLGIADAPTCDERLSRRREFE